MAMSPSRQARIATKAEMSDQDLKLLINENKKAESKLLKYALILMTLAFLIMLGAFVASVIFTLKMMRDRNAVEASWAENKSGGSELTDVEKINEIPISRIDKTQSLYLQWGEFGSADEKQYFFEIHAAQRTPFKNETILFLSAHHQLFITKDSAVLYDEAKAVAGVVDFKKRREMQGAQGEDLRALGVASNKPILKGGLLQKYGKYPNNKKGFAPTDAFDAYCRYGCGEMAVRFPYYYRPFFGYGFPLVGTESQFPQGYGGYPMAPQMMQQGLAQQQGMVQTVTIPPAQYQMA